MGEGFRTNGINDIVNAYAERQRERKLYALEIIMSCVCVCVTLVQLLKMLTDIHEIWYVRNAIASHPSALSSQ